MYNKIRLSEIAIAVLLLTGGALYSPGQVDIRMQTEPRRALLHESVFAELRIDNNTNHQLRLGGEQANARLEFDISDMRGRSVRERAGRPALNRDVVLEPFTTKTIQVDLVDAYQIVESRPYKVRCIIQVNGTRFSSNQSYFDVNPGTRIASQTISRNGTARVYQLIYLYRDNHAELFLRVEDEDGSICYGVYNFGNYIRIQDAQMRFDNQGRIHLLFQSGPRRFSHFVLTQAGQTEERKFYSGVPGRIELTRSREGDVSVEGGDAYQGDLYSPGFDFRTNRIFE